ncbi:hypothetical protein D9M68_966910 [compost metagenome]
MVAKVAGYSRQALQANAEIKKAYTLAKKGMAARTHPRLLKRASTKSHQELLDENVVLRARLEKLEAREIFWKRRWYTIAYNIRQKGLQMEQFDRTVPFAGPPMQVPELQAILNAWNEDIPPVTDRPK